MIGKKSRNYQVAGPERARRVRQILWRLKSVYASGAFYTVITSIEAFVPFVITPVLTRFLSLGSYGVWTLFVSFVSLVRPVVSLSFNEAIRMNYYDLNGGERAQYTATAFILSTMAALALLASVFLLRQPLSVAMRFPADWIPSIVIAAYLFGIFYFLLAFNQFANDRRHFALLHILQAGVSLALISALVLLGGEWQGAILGKIVGLLACVVIGMLWLTPSLEKANLTKPDFSYAKQLVRFGWLYLPAGLTAVLAGLTDRLVIAHVLGLEQTSYYGIAELFGSVLMLAVNGFIHGWMPWLFRHLSDHGRTDSAQVWAISVVYFILIPIGGVVVYGASLIVAPVIVGERFQGALQLVPFAIAVMALRGYFVHNQVFLLFKKKVGAISISSVLFVSLNIVLSFALIYPYGIEGVFAATCISYFCASILSGVWAMQIYRK